MHDQRFFRVGWGEPALGPRRDWVVCALILALPGVAWSQAANPLGIPNYLQGSAAPRPPVSAGGSALSDFSGLPGAAGLPYQPPQWRGERMGPGGATVGGGDGGIWERLRLNLFASVGFSYSDNSLQGTSTTGRQDDFTIDSMVGGGADWRVTENSRLSLQLGVGYRYSLNYADLTQFNLIPVGSLNYSFLVGDVMFTLFNEVSSPPQLRTEVVGAGAPTGVDFNRINNQTGLTAVWAPTDTTALSSSYSYQISRGFSENLQFSVLDSDAHMVSGGAFHRLGPYWTLGLSGQVAKTQFTQGFQNDSLAYGAGPVVSFRPNSTLTISASVQYTIVEFGSGGAVGDTQEFAGFTYNGGIQHQLTRNITHGVNFTSGINSGLGSNFTEMTSVSYQLAWRFISRMSLNVNFDYTNFKQSASTTVPVIIEVPDGFFVVPVNFITNDSGDQYNIMAGTGLQITQHLNAMISYGYSKRESRFADRSFDASTISLFFNYTF